MRRLCHIAAVLQIQHFAIVTLLRPVLLAIATALLIWQTGCASPHVSAPIVDRYNPAEKPPAYYVVVQGDTLFSISWRYGFELERLATANNIAQPYTIYPGQKIVLQESSSPVSRSKPPPSATRGPEPTRSASVTTPLPKATTPAVPQANSRPVMTDDGRWRWPVEGPVIRRFIASGQAHKGVDIKGKMGEPVRASRGGTVVYSGNGLVGYGNLLIVKHAGNYLSAYGHNRRLLKQEGEIVKAGEVIAELGDSGTDSAKLHFEVRKEGKPVDPLAVLPKR